MLNLDKMVILPVTENVWALSESFGPNCLHRPPVSAACPTLTIGLIELLN